MSDADFSLLDLFRDEVKSHTATLGQGLLDLEREPGDARKIEPLMRAAHSIKGAARIVGLDAPVGLAHVMEDALVAAQNGKITLGSGEIDVLLRGSDRLAELGQANEEGMQAWGVTHKEEIEDLILRLEAIARGERDPRSEKQEVVVVVPPPVVVEVPKDLPQPIVTLASPSPPTSLPQVEKIERKDEQSEAVVRVTAQSLNRLMSLAGESLVQARWLQPFAMALLKLKKHQDRLAGLIDQLGDCVTEGRRQDQLEPLLDDSRRQLATVTTLLTERIREFEEHAAQAEDLNSRLYREVIVSRMRPFADGAHGFPRLVRDMARKLGKQVRLEIDGLTTEVDRDILEKLEAPLMHLLRNAVDHGIEMPDERRASGKPEEGVLRLEVRHTAGMLAITVRDDGGGIDLERLERKVVDRGLTTAEMAGNMSEAELLEFLFLPGFSTATELTEYSGRGVGLDVVQDTVRKVGGSARISSKLGQGTSFHLQLPITLSVLRAVLVDIAGEPYAFPHNRIDRLLRVERGNIRSLEHRQFVNVDGQNVGLVLAAQLLDLPGELSTADELPVVLLSDGTGQYGLIVEAFQGEQDLVVRPLDPRLGKVPSISAAAILDDGSPVLIADVEDMIRGMDHFIQSGSLRRCDLIVHHEKKRKRVLVVDDSITVREVERQLLRNEGYDVDVAVDGRDGWNQVRLGGYDLVVSDIDMPRMTGLELVKLIREHQDLRNLPIVIISYKDREEDRLRGLELGANFYLTKSSFHDNRFLQVVRDLLGE